MGGGNINDYYKVSPYDKSSFMNKFSNVTLPSVFTLDLTDMAGGRTAESMFSGSGSGGGAPATSLKYLRIIGAEKTALFSNTFYMYNNKTRLVTIEGDLSQMGVSYFASGNAFVSMNSLRNIRFLPNSIPYKILFQQSPKLTINSLVSIANGLSTKYVGSNTTLGLHATSKALLKKIYGTVDEDMLFTKTFVIENTEEDIPPEGTINLEEFITGEDYKFWTLA